MIDENSRRRSGFRNGIAIRLADGRPWIFPEPVSGRALDDPHLLAILEAIREAEDHVDLLRAELVLAIHLLGRNYELGPEDYQELLAFEPGGTTLAQVQRAIHNLALAYCSSATGSGKSPVTDTRFDRRIEPRRLPARGISRLLRKCLSGFRPSVSIGPIGSSRD
jgi:hypothetical protein